MSNERHMNQRHISVTAATHAKLQQYCRANNRSMSEVVDLACSDIVVPRRRSDRTPLYLVEVDESTLSLCRDQVARESVLRRRQTTVADVFEMAVVRMLDALGAPR